MSISKNWKAVSISGIADYELITTGEANVGLLTVMPELKKKIPQGINPSILQLDLFNAADASPENFKPVQYNEKINDQGQYQSVEIFYNGKSIELIKVTKV
jgi:hypothetical protein